MIWPGLPLVPSIRRPSVDKDVFWAYRALTHNPNVMTRGAASTSQFWPRVSIYTMISDADNMLGHKNHVFDMVILTLEPDLLGRPKGYPHLCPGQIS